MKIVAVLIISGFALVTSKSIKLDDQVKLLKDSFNDKCNKETFKVWKAEHGRKFLTSSKENKALKNYIDKCKICADHNENYHKGKVSFKCKIDRWSHLSTEEFYKVRGGLVAPELNIPLLFASKPANSGPSLSLSSDTDPPVNWTASGVVSPVRDQGECGSCWAFAATGALESQYKIKFNRTVILSPQYFVDCCTHFNYGCKGGNPYNVYNWFALQKPLVTDASYPYVAKTQNCMYNSSMEHVTPAPKGVLYPVILNNDENKLKVLVRDLGPIAVMFQATYLFALYSSGIFVDPNCGNSTFNHMVLLTGYGTDNGTDYWSIKNSWGTDWGEYGYMRLARNRGSMCGIAIMGGNPHIPPK